MWGFGEAVISHSSLLLRTALVQCSNLNAEDAFGEIEPAVIYAYAWTSTDPAEKIPYSVTCRPDGPGRHHHDHHFNRLFAYIDRPVNDIFNIVN